MGTSSTPSGSHFTSHKDFKGTSLETLNAAHSRKFSLWTEDKLRIRALGFHFPTDDLEIRCVIVSNVRPFKKYAFDFLESKLKKSPMEKYRSATRYFLNRRGLWIGIKKAVPFSLAADSSFPTDFGESGAKTLISAAKWWTDSSSAISKVRLDASCRTLAIRSLPKRTLFEGIPRRLVNFGNQVGPDPRAIGVPRCPVLSLVPCVLLRATNQKREGGNDGQVVDSQGRFASYTNWKRDEVSK